MPTWWHRLTLRGTAVAFKASTAHLQVRQALQRVAHRQRLVRRKPILADIQAPQRCDMRQRAPQRRPRRRAGEAVAREGEARERGQRREGAREVLAAGAAYATVGEVEGTDAGADARECDGGRGQPRLRKISVSALLNASVLRAM
jgi:hypothetical protein